MGRTYRCEKNGLNKGPWMPEEDKKLIDYIQKHGPGSWPTVPKSAGLARCGKSCRLRWKNYLSPDIKRETFSFEEEERIIQLHSMLGNKWSAIAAHFPGRTDNAIKMYWNTRIKKRLLRMGIDPVTHSPRLDLLDLHSLLNLSLYNPNYRFDYSRFLGVEPLVNSELIRLATNILPSPCQNTNLLGQSLQEPQLPTPQVQDLFPSFQAHLLQNPIQEFPPWTTSNVQFLDKSQLVKANVEQFQQQAQSNLWQDNVTQANLSQNFVPDISVCFDNFDPSIPQPISGNTNFLATNSQINYKLTSVLPTPSIEPKPIKLLDGVREWQHRG